MKGGESLSQLLKNVQGRKPSGTDTATMIVLGFVAVGIIAVLVGTFVMVKGLKPSTPTVTTVPSTDSTPTTSTSTDTALLNQTSSGTPALGTQTNPLIQTQPDTQFPTVSAGVDTSGLFNQKTQTPNTMDPYAKMQQIGTMLFLGPKDIMVQGIEAVNSAYQGADREAIKQALEGKATDETTNKLYTYNQRLFLYGKRFSGNWYYFLTDSDKNAPVINLVVNGRDCGNEQQTGCQELFNGQYYEVAPQMTQYLAGLTNTIIGKEQGALGLLRMKAELYPLKF